MSFSSARRAVAGVSVLAVAAGSVLLGLGMGVAGAAEATSVTEGSGYEITRKISNQTPSEGEEITSTTTLKRKSWVVSYLYGMTEFLPECMTYVPGSAKVEGVTYTTDAVASGVRVTNGGWALYENDTREFQFKYTVGAGCEREVDKMTTVHFNGSGGLDDKNSYRGPTINVPKNTTTTTLTSAATAQVGTATTLSAAVTRGANGNPVDFYSGATKIGSGTLSGGTATYVWTPTTRGTQSITARFVATDKANGSTSTPRNVIVTQPDAVSTTVIATISGAQVGTATDLKATVSPSTGGGSVTFLLNGTTLAVLPVSAAGVASYSWTPQTAGSHEIIADYSGGSGVEGSNAVRTVVVAPRPANLTDSTTTLTATDGTPGVAQTISAQVSPADAGGTVTFRDGSTVIGTVAVNAAGNASISWIPAELGQRTIRAEYSGAGLVGASADEVLVQVTQVADGGGDGGGSLGNMGNIFGS